MHVLLANAACKIYVSWRRMSAAGGNWNNADVITELIDIFEPVSSLAQKSI